MVPAPATAVTLPAVQVVVKPLGVAITIFPGLTGKVVVNTEDSVVVVALLLPKVMVKRLVLLGKILATDRFCATLGNCSTTRVALAAVVLLMTCAVDSAPTGIMLT